MRFRGGKRIGVVVLAAALFLLPPFSGAKALKERTLRASCPSACGEAVVSRAVRDGQVLSLPGTWDLTRVTLEIEDADELYLGDAQAPFLPGQPGDLTGMTGRSLVMRNQDGMTLGNVTILHGSRIPALFLTVDAEQLKAAGKDKNRRIEQGHACFLDADGSVGYDGEITQLKGRGNNTFRYAKKPWQVKLSEKAPLGGMRAAKTWVLLANWCDISLLRNQVVMDVSRAAGLRNALDCRQADVWINGQYNGLYLLSEKIQVGKERIPLTNLEKAAEKVEGQPEDPGRMIKGSTPQLPLTRYYPDVKDPEDITGGYIATIEKTHRLRDYALAGFKTEDGLNVQIKEPTNPSQAQTEYLGGVVRQAQQALMARDGRNPETGRDFSGYLDLESFAIRALTEEWCKNYDLLGGSQFFYKDSDAADPLIYAGPAWDYDLSFGNMKDRGYSPEADYIAQFRKNSNLYWLLEQHESFTELEKKLWREKFRPALAVLLGEKEGTAGENLCSLDEYRGRIADSAAMNAVRWGVNSAATGPYSGENFDHAFSYLQNWITKRTAWLDARFGTGE